VLVDASSSVDGRKRLRTDVLADTPMRVDLSIERGGIHGTTAYLAKPGGDELLCRPLLNCRVVPLRGDSMIVSGVHETQGPGEPRLLPQHAWWCRLPIWKILKPVPGHENLAPEEAT
jgi:hypothetical protein